VEIPVIAEFVNADIRSLDLALQFNESKLLFDTAFAIVSDMELVSHYNSSDNYLRIISTRNSAAGISTGSVIAHIKFMLLNPCEVVYSTDFDSLHVWLNGEMSGFEIIDGSTLPDPIQILSSAPYCVGSPIDMAYSQVFNGVLIQNYAWSFGDGSVASGQTVSANISAPGATPILLTMTGVNGCVYQVPSEIFVSTSPVASFTYTYDSASEVVTFANSSTIASGTISSYDWSFGDGGVSSDANPTYTYTAAGIFTATLTATSAQGCASEYSLQVNASVGIDELLNKSVVSVYPNPANSNIHVVAKDAVSMHITDYRGRIVMQRSLRGSDDQMLDISSLAEGMYNVVIETASGFHTTRIVKIN
jgi:chitodextrinase